MREVFLETKKRRSGRHPPHVLIVEDDPLTRRVVVGILGEANAMITEENARGAVASYLLYAPDIVFLDIGLPDISGFDVLDQIMTIDPDAFVIMFSSHDDAQNIGKALAAGAKGFVSKPFKKETLKSFIQGSALHHHKSYV
ncbi:MAG: response regulator [Pseudomonadota bacterium]|nr:response regulator [Pseudomonadota bacterium]